MRDDGPSNAESAAGSAKTKAEQVTRRIQAALSRRQFEIAARIHMEACAHHLFPTDEGALPGLRRILGSENVEKLIAAYAKLPCFYCNKGMVPCEECGGRGRYDNLTICTPCLSLGIDRCGFCGGSGWFTINHVPSEMQAHVVIRRVVVAAKEANDLLAGELPPLTHDKHAEARKGAARRLLQMNRLLGVLENMVVVARQILARQDSEPEVMRKAIAAAESTGSRLNVGACQTLEHLANTFEIEAEAATRSSSRDLARRRAEFYAGLASSGNFIGTSLRHPMLFPMETAAAAPEGASDSKKKESPGEVDAKPTRGEGSASKDGLPG